MEKCVFDRDTLFSFVILDNQNFTDKLKRMNKQIKLTPDLLKAMPDFDLYFYNWYYYSNNLAVF